MTARSKTYTPANEEAPVSQIGASLEALATAIAARRGTGSYTDSLLSGPVDAPLKKLMEEAGEVALAAKDVEGWATSAIASALALDAQQAVNHLRYEAADVAYHLMVVLERFGIGPDEFAAELNSRMTEAERPVGAAMLRPDDIERGK